MDFYYICLSTIAHSCIISYGSCLCTTGLNFNGLPCNSSYTGGPTPLGTLHSIVQSLWGRFY